jgi:AraC family transcriptional regulator
MVFFLWVNGLNEVTVVAMEPQLVLGMRKRGHYAMIPEMFMQVFTYVMEQGVECTGPPTFVMHEISAEEARKADQEGNADVEIAVPIGRKVPDTAEIRCYTLPGGSMARIVHKGPYEACEPTYETLFAWLEKNGKRITGPLRETYLNDPGEVPPDEILTEIYAPID